MTTSFLERVRAAMETYFGPDERRIDHARQVATFAEDLLRFIDADESITMTAAYLHDIGIPEAERKYGSCGGSHQEQEGPPVARTLLRQIGADETFVEAVCTLVGKHHTPSGVDSPEFRILWDADALVNLAQILPGKPPERIRAILDKTMVTEPGYRQALGLFLGGGDRAETPSVNPRNQKQL